MMFDNIMIEVNKRSGTSHKRTRKKRKKSITCNENFNNNISTSYKSVNNAVELYVYKVMS